jgi:pyrimidine-nucleoside phosphorylase
VLLGAGRFSMEDSIDPAAGITIHRKIGDFVSKNDALATLHFNDQGNVPEASHLVEESYFIEPSPPPPFQLVHEVIYQERE